MNSLDKVVLVGSVSIGNLLGCYWVYRWKNSSNLQVGAVVVVTDNLLAFSAGTQSWLWLWLWHLGWVQHVPGRWCSWSRSWFWERCCRWWCSWCWWCWWQWRHQLLTNSVVAKYCVPLFSFAAKVNPLKKLLLVLADWTWIGAKLRTWNPGFWRLTAAQSWLPTKEFKATNITRKNLIWFNVVGKSSKFQMWLMWFQIPVWWGAVMTCLVQARFPLTPPYQRDYIRLKFWDFNIPIGTRLR